MLDQPALFPDTQVAAALSEVFAHPALLQGMQAILSPDLFEKIKIEANKAQTVYDFQIKIIRPILMHIKDISISTLSSEGLEQLDPEKKYLFISNHRDIVLDSAFLNIVLVESNFSTCQIAIGDNLMQHRLSELIFLLNKSFIIKRSGSAMELYRYSVRLSEYIHKTIVESSDSIWIAQREGRAKDGNDRTQIALLKMLCLSTKVDLQAFFKDLQIVPVSISYQYNPCAVPITQEFLAKKDNLDYKKAFAEDLSHILLGLKGQKGAIHFHFSKPLDTEMDNFSTFENRNQQLAYLAEVIDKKIHANYQLHPINYVAYSLLTGEKLAESYYTPAELLHYTAYFKENAAKLKNDTEQEGYAYLLKMYANPVLNKL